MFACQYCGGMREPGYFVCPHCRTQNGTPHFQSGNAQQFQNNYDDSSQPRWRPTYRQVDLPWWVLPSLYFLAVFVFAIVANVYSHLSQ